MRAEELEQVLYELYRGEGGMTALELTQKELEKLNKNYDKALLRKGVTDDELQNIAQKIVLKREIVRLLESADKVQGS